jgi:hypothetical protein
VLPDAVDGLAESCPLVTRLDLFTSPHCPACPAAREAVAAFARARPDVVVHEWDLTRDPGPAVGRGIVATPVVLVNESRILLGVPDPLDLARAAETGLRGRR